MTEPFELVMTKENGNRTGSPIAQESDGDFNASSDVDLIKNWGSIGIVICNERNHAAPYPAIKRLPPATCRAHIVLNRYKVDHKGRLCLTPNIPFSELRTYVEVLKAQLDALVDDAEGLVAG